MAERLTILVATMTGTAEMVAEEVQATLAGRGWSVEVLTMDALDPAVFAREGRFLVCSSTYGQGDVPDNGQALYEALEAGKPDLGHVEYGVIALGDTTYAETYCGGGRRFDERLGALGARRIGEPLFHDASSDVLPEDAAVDWVAAWADLVDEARAIA